MKKEFDIQDLNALERIQKVDAPPFLFTRIQEKIKEQKTPRFSTNWSWAIGLSFLFVVVLNVVAISSQMKNNDSTTELAESLNLLTNNNLYYE